MKELIKLLEDNARYTNAELADILGISEKEVADKIAKLEKDGVIRGYKALIDWDQVSDDCVTALIELKVTPQKVGFEEIAEYIMNMEEVESVYLMSGSFDLTVIVKGRTFKEVALFVSKRLAPLDVVTSTATHFVLRRYKDMGVPLVDSNSDDRGMLWL